MNGNTTSKAGRRSGCSLPVPRRRPTNFNPGDIGYVKRNNGHWVKNTGNTELQFLEVFKSPIFQDVSLSDWLTHTPPAMVAATFNIDPAVIAKWPKDKPEIPSQDDDRRAISPRRGMAGGGFVAETIHWDLSTAERTNVLRSRLDWLWSAYSRIAECCWF